MSFDSSQRRLALLAFAAFSCAAQAQSIPTGRLLASNCFQCHGTDGKGPGFEKLAGKSASDIYHELVEMRAGKEGDGLMSRHAMGYTDAQLRAIAQYFGSRR
jgi:cytochrome c553